MATTAPKTTPRKAANKTPPAIPEVKAALTKTPTETDLPAPKLPKSWPRENARILLKPYDQGKLYPAGTLCLVSGTPIPEMNAANDVVVIPPTIIVSLDIAAVTGPYPGKQ